MYDNLNTTTALKSPLMATDATALYRSTDQNMINARDTLIPELACPSNPNSLYLNQTANQGSRIAVTNYKAMGATNMISLGYCLPGATANPYGSAVPLVSSSHPDGAVYPGKQNRIADFMDGTAHTIITLETMDFSGNAATPSTSCSAWFAGQACTLVGTPSPGAPNISYQPASTTVGSGYPFVIPNGFNGKYDADAASTVQLMRTYLQYDFPNTNAGQYPDPSNLPSNLANLCNIAGGVPPYNSKTYGPSSGHPSVVNHLFGDGAVRTIRKDVDFAMYFFAITRNNNDPAPNFD